MDHVSLSRFKSAIRKGEPAGPVMLRKQGITIIEPLEDRRVRFTISTATADRENDTVAVNGWDLTAYMQNPVVLWGHCHHGLPVGKCVDIGVEANALKATVEFVPGEMPEIGGMAEAVLRLCRTGFLSATSVGFRPLEFEVANDRDEAESWWPPVNFLRQELMEFSIVSIPANPEALIDPAERVVISQIAPPLVPTHEQVAEQLAADANFKRADIMRARKRRALEARLIEIG